MQSISEIILDTSITLPIKRTIQNKAKRKQSMMNKIISEKDDSQVAYSQPKYTRKSMLMPRIIIETPSPPKKELIVEFLESNFEDNDNSMTELKRKDPLRLEETNSDVATFSQSKNFVTRNRELEDFRTMMSKIITEPVEKPAFKRK